MRSAATCARSRAVWTDRPVCLGKYWRSRPLVFSFRPLDTEAGMTSPLRWPACHGRSAYLRRQPARIVDGRMEGGYTGLFELICPSCGDHPYLDYSEVPPRLQWLRGPRTLKGGVAAYEKHLGLALRPDAA